MNEIVIENVKQDQIDQILELEKICFSEPWTREMLLSQMPDESHIFLIAEQGGRVLGYVGLMHVLDEGYISNVAVAPDARRRGIGKGLITELQRRAVENKLAFITLEVRESNLSAIELYKKCEFFRVGLRKNYYENPRENAVLMTKLL